MNESLRTCTRCGDRLTEDAWLRHNCGPTCPECVTGKHGNCDGTAYDHDSDEITTCHCREGACAR